MKAFLGCVLWALAPRIMARREFRRERVSGEPELLLVPALCDKQHDFLDVGANSGLYSLYARNFARRVMAFEPHPHMARRLRRLLGRDVVFEIGLSDHSGTAELSVPMQSGREVATRSSLEEGANPGFALRQVEVVLSRLDDLVTSNVGAMKIDVEGHELRVLDGARATLERDRPTIIIESEDRHQAGSVIALRKRLEPLGYRGHFIHRGELRDIEDFSVRQFQSPEAALEFGGRRSVDYINNFVFIHSQRRHQLEAIQRLLEVRDRHQWRGRSTAYRGLRRQPH